MAEQNKQDSGRAWLFVICGVALLAGAVVLLMVLGSGGPEDEEGEEEPVEVKGPSGQELTREELARARERNPEDRRLVVRPSGHGGLLKSSQRTQHLIRQVRLGGKTNDQIIALQLKGKRIQVTVSGPSMAKGKMDGDRWEIMKENLPKFASCYQDRLVEKPGLTGKVVLDITIKPRTKEEMQAVGTVAKASTIKDFKLQQCILQRLSSVPFPKHMVKDVNRKPEQYVINLEPTAGDNATQPVTTRTEPEPPPPDEHPPPKEETKKEPPPKEEPKKEEPPPKEEPKEEPPPKEETPREEPGEEPPDEEPKEE